MRTNGLEVRSLYEQQVCNAHASAIRQAQAGGDNAVNALPYVIISRVGATLGRVESGEINEPGKYGLYKEGDAGPYSATIYNATVRRAAGGKSFVAKVREPSAVDFFAAVRRAIIDYEAGTLDPEAVAGRPQRLETLEELLA